MKPRVTESGVWERPFFSRPETPNHGHFPFCVDLFNLSKVAKHFSICLRAGRTQGPGQQFSTLCLTRLRATSNLPLRATLLACVLLGTQIT